MTSRGAVQYELAAAHDLPVIDVSRTVQSVLLTSASLRVFERVTKRCEYVFLFFYIIAFPIGAAVLIVPAEYARLLSLFKFSFQIPLLVVLTGELQWDILSCLTSCYDFLFFSILNAITCVVFAINFSDLRVLMAPVYWWGIQICVCADAKIHDSRVAGASALAALYHVFLLGVFGLQLTPDAHVFPFFRNAKHSMSSSDFLFSAASTMMLLMARTAYRQRPTQRDRDRGAERLSSYRCRVRLRAIEAAPAAAPRTASGVARRRSDPGGSSYLVPSGSNTSIQAASLRQRLQLVKRKDAYDSSDLVSPALLYFVQQHTSWRLPAVAGVMGVVGFALTVAAFACSISWDSTQRRASTLWVLSLTGLLCSLAFGTSVVGLYQRQLLKRITSSFDFVFMALQNTLTYASICDMLQWDVRCVAVATAGLWLLWVLMLDALTPIVRTTVGFRARRVIPVLLLAVGIQCVFVRQIMFAESAELQDRVLWSPSVLGFTMSLRTVPFFFGRVVTLVLWTLRLLWRLCTSSEDSLLMIQGAVEFYNSSPALQRKIQVTRTLSQASTTQLTPTQASTQSSIPSLGSARVHPMHPPES